MRRLRSLEVCVVVPGEDEGTRTSFWVAKGQVVDRRPFTGMHGLEWQAGIAAVARAEPTPAPDAPDHLPPRAAFLRRPPPAAPAARAAGVPAGRVATWGSGVAVRSAMAGASWWWPGWPPRRSR